MEERSHRPLRWYRTAFALLAAAGIAVACTSSTDPPTAGRGCDASTGPAPLGSALWADASEARKALARSGFSRLELRGVDGRRLPLHVYRPTGFDPRNGRIWFVMHGVRRNADHYASVAAAAGERHQVLVVAPEFGRRHYRGTAAYTLGMAARAGQGDGRRPLPGSHADLERAFDAIRSALGGEQTGYYLFGHSAGGQFVHRLLTFLPCARVEGAVAANAGWYTLPAEAGEAEFDLPYSLRGADAAAIDLDGLLGAPLTLLLGTRDTKGPDQDANLRASPGAMAQGPHRLARGQHYFEQGRRKAQAIGVDFGWRLQLAHGAGHNVREVADSAAELLFSPSGSAVCSPDTSSGPAGRPAFALVGGAERRRGGASGSFVSVVNVGEGPLCLAGWQLRTADGRGGHLFPLAPALQPGEASIVQDIPMPPSAPLPANVHRANARRGLFLNPEGDVLTLESPSGRTTLRMSWGDCAGARCADAHLPGALPSDGAAPAGATGSPALAAGPHPGEPVPQATGQAAYRILRPIR